MRSASQAGTRPPCLPVLPAIESAFRLIEGSESDGVPQTVNRWDAVLPFMTRSALQKIDRTGLCNERSTLPFGGRYLAAQSEVTGCHQRDADDDAELRAVAMPADASTWAIFSDQDVLQHVGGHVRKAGSLLPYGHHKFGNCFSRTQTTGIEIVLQSERHHPPFALKTLELERFQGQASEGANERPLLF